MKPYSQESLVTGGDDHFLPKLIHEINQAARIDIAVSFIRASGHAHKSIIRLDLLNLPQTNEVIELNQTTKL